MDLGFQKALFHRDFDKCRELMASGLSIEARDNDGRVYLHAMAERGNIEASQFLLQAGANPNAKDYNRVAPLHLASREGHVDVCRALLAAGADVNDPGRSNLPPLWYATIHKETSVCQVLIEHGASSSFVPEGAEKDYLTIFQKMVAQDSKQMVRWFVLEAGEDLGQRTLSGKTMIQLAGKSTAMKTLLRALKTDLAIRVGFGTGDVGIADLKATQTGVPVATTRGMSPL